MKAFQFLRSALLLLIIYPWMAVLGILAFPFAVVSKRGAWWTCKIWAMTTIFLARWLVGIRTEIRGTVPTGEVMIAAKHQSFFDILMIYNALPHAKFIMKRELLWTPFIGLYAKRLGCVPVERGKKGGAIAQMVKDVASEFEEPGQLVIYPQGTRVSPGDHVPYKVGTAVLYEGLEYPCVPVAANVGLFWPRKGIMRNPGTAVVEFLDPIEPGVAKRDFMRRLEAVVEEASDRLMAEAGYHGKD